jgi:DeoR/GlpR family transcriptional regulator of sugar metabolism
MNRAERLRGILDRLAAKGTVDVEALVEVETV